MNPVGLNPKKFRKQAKIESMQAYIRQLEATVGYLKGKLDERSKTAEGSNMPALSNNIETDFPPIEMSRGGMLEGEGQVGEVGERAREVSFKEKVMADPMVTEAEGD